MFNSYQYNNLEVINSIRVIIGIGTRKEINPSGLKIPEGEESKKFQTIFFGSTHKSYSASVT